MGGQQRPGSPPRLRQMKAGAGYGIPWPVLAGIGTVESGNGQSDAPGLHSGTNAFGAAGPMQFGVGGAAGNTWGGAPVHPATQHTSGYGIDGDGDGLVDVYDPGDAIPSAARFLQAHGAPASMRAAIFAFSSALCQQAALGPLPPGAPARSSPTQQPSSASPTSSAAPGQTPTTAP